MTSRLEKFTCGHIGIKENRDDTAKMECERCRPKEARLKEMVKKAHRKLGQKLHKGYELALAASKSIP